MSRIVVIAPHADDETLGLGGTIARRCEEEHSVVVAILTGPGEDPHPIWPHKTWDVVRREACEAHRILGVHETVFRNIPAAMVPDRPIHEVTEIVSSLLAELEPEILYVPFLFDLHLDHRLLTYACNVAWRPTEDLGKSIREIYMYETLSETHWNIQPSESGFLPNAFVDISGRYLQKKLDALSCYVSQIREFPDCRSLEAIEALAKLRGSTVGVEAAEAFVLVRSLDNLRSRSRQ